MGESKLPFFAFVDETGNTGHNIFDEVQPDFLTAALISRGNFDAQFGARVAAIAGMLDHSTLHGKELGVHRIERIAGDLLTLLKAAKATFFVSRVEKKYLLVTKMFDSIFDSGENAGISWHHYNMRPLRLLLTFKLSYLIEETTARTFWKCILEPKETRAREGLVEVCSDLLENITFLPDEGSRKVLGDALEWARDHPEAIQIHVDRKIARQGHDRVPRRGVALAVAVLPDRAGNGSACGWQADERIIAHRGDCLKCHVAGPLDGPFVVLFEQQRTD